MIVPGLFNAKREDLYPSPYPSQGLLQAHFDSTGGGFLETTTFGTLFTVDSANRIVIPQAQGGGKVTWVRGVWASSVIFRYVGFMADLDPSMTLPSAANYAMAANTDINTWNCGSGATFNTTASGGVVTAATLASGGVGYAVGNIVPLNGGSNDAYVVVTAVSSAYNPTTNTGGAISAVGSLHGGTSGYVSTNGVTSMQAVNLPTETIITLQQPVAQGSSVQCSYIYRNGTVTNKGAAIGGWPNLHTSIQGQDYGTANDGDNYTVGALYYAYKATGLTQYKTLADKIQQAQFNAGGPTGQLITFDIPFTAQEEVSGLYNYYGNGATFAWNVTPVPDGSGLNGLNVQATMTASPQYAGWGMWPSWPVTTNTPFNGVSFDFWGDGSDNLIQLSTNIHSPSDSAGSYVYGFPCLPAYASKKYSFSLLPTDFWNTANILYNGDRTNGYISVSSSDGSATYSRYSETGPSASGFSQFFSTEFTISATSTYANIVFGLDTGTWATSSTTNFKMDLVSSAAGNIDITVTDANSTQFTYTYAATATSQVVNVPWSTFGAVVHPIQKVTLQPAFNSASLRINNIRAATSTTDIISLGTSTITLLNGFQFQFETYGSYNVWFKNFQINQTQVNPYPNVSRWTYDWWETNGYFGSGSWRGAQAPAYLWLLGYTLSGLTYPANTIAMYADGTTVNYSGLPVANCIRRMMQDSQNAYAAQYPTAVKGPMMKKYGCWSWESVQGSGYIAGTAVPNATYPDGVLNEWYCEGNDDWAGYQYRAWLSVAEDYFVSGDATSLSILNNWVSWANSTFTYSAGTKVVTMPSTFNVDGTLANSSYLYGHICAVEAMLYKYWRDGDATCLTWIPRLLDDLHYNFKYTTTGNPKGVRMTAYGSGYTTCTATITDTTGAGLTAVPYVSGGMVTHTSFTGTVTSAYTNPTITYSGDGTGAAGKIYMDNALYGAYDPQHTGWEIAEYGKVLGMLLNGRSSIGTVVHAYTPPSYASQDYADIWTFYTNNASDEGPGMLLSNWIPVHEFARMSSWHWGCAIENPLNGGASPTYSRDTHTDGDLWTESLGPSIFYAVDRWQSSGDNKWLAILYDLVTQMAA